jgi:DtxR family Mn-dependent transcriptional regulator
MISRAEQDYIKSIFTLQQETGSTTTSALARKLNITPASVSGMLRKLGQAKLISRRHYRGVKLTKRGERYASAVLRRHRLIELFLVEILGMPWEKVHHEAEVLEHVISDEVLDRINELLDFPEYDPHGSPIPPATGEITAAPTVRLDEMKQGSKGIIAEIPDDDPELIQYLSKQGLVPGARLRVTEILALDGTRVLRCGEKEISVSPTVAAALRVLSDPPLPTTQDSDG